MKKFAVMSLLLTMLACAASAQNYNWGIGLRGGAIANGFDARINLDPANSLRGIFSFSRGVCFYGLYERNVPVIAQGFNFYYGAGAHVGTWKWNDDKGTFGIDAVAGLEYTMREAPVAFAAEWKPGLNLTGHTGLKGYDFGLSVKYVF